MMERDLNGIHLFTALERNYAFDIYRFQTYDLSAAAYDVLNRFLTNLDKVGSSIEYYLSLEPWEMTHWLSLVKAGLVRDDYTCFLPNLTLPPYSKAINSVVLNVAEDCNFACTYCFGQKGLYGRSKGKLMDYDVAIAAVDWLLKRSSDHKFLSIAFFGGEPLLNLPLIREVVNYTNKRVENMCKKISYNMTTNVSLLSKKVLHELDALKVVVQVSVDGIGKCHDVHRRFINGQGSWQIVNKNLKHLLTDGRKMNARATIAHGNADIKMIVNDLLDYGFANVFVCPATGIDGAAITMEDVRTIKSGLDKLAAQYLEMAKKGTIMSGFTNLHRQVKRLMEPRFVFTGCSAGKNYFTIGASGDIYVCMHVVHPQSSHRIGNVLTDEFDEDMHRLFQTLIVDDKETCSKCWARYLCGNACFARNLNMGHGFDKADPDFCAIETRTYELALSLVALMKEQGLRPASEGKHTCETYTENFH